MKYSTPYVPPTVTVDAVIFQLIDQRLHVLLIKRSNEPFKGMWALPGGYNPEGETTIDALKRIVLYKTSIDITSDLTYIEQLYTFDNIARDPRGHAVSVVYMGCGRNMSIQRPASEIAFFPVDSLPNLAYDHEDIIRYAHQRLATKISYTNAIYAFLPPLFTLTQLQTAYEAILDYPLDKRNFRKKFLGLGLVDKTNKTQRDGAHRPAQLYTFKSQTLQPLPRAFD